MVDFAYLSTLIWLPIVVGCIMFLTSKKLNTSVLQVLALSTSILCILICVPIINKFDVSTWQMQYVENLIWLDDIGVKYALGIDGFALPLAVLTCFMSLLVIITGVRSVKTNVIEYFAAFLIMQGLMCGVFFALDVILFYIFFEAMLIPMFIIIGVWGGANRVYATIKFFLYTFLGSVLLLIAIVYLNNLALTQGFGVYDSFSISTFSQLELNLFQQKWIFWGFLLAFAVKVPMWPVHTWLPDAHVEAPTGGSVILAAITLKIGGYGFLRFLLPIVPEASAYFANVIIAMSLIAIAYIGLVAIIQKDMKKLIAYSSISHMGFVTLGIFLVFEIIKNTADESAAVIGIEGAMVQMISHGFISAALFLCVGVLYDRMKSRDIKDYGGVANKMPVFAAFFMLFAMANLGLPGTSGFVGEFMVIFAAFQAKFIYAFIAGLTLVFGASYTLWMYKRVMLGDVKNSRVNILQDLTVNEIIVFTMLGILVLLVGIWPQLILTYMHSASVHLIDTIR